MKINKVSLGSVAKVFSGYAFKSSEFRENGIPVVKIKNVRVGHVDLNGAECVDERFLDIADRYHISGGEILISLTGSHMSQPNSVVGRVARYSLGQPRCLINQRVGKIVVTDFQSCDPSYLFYALSEPETVRAIAMLAQGAASQANVSPKQVENTEIWMPPMHQQRGIAAILGAYDDLIETNRRQVVLLEEMARSLFEEWFVRFRFPGHENVAITETLEGLLPTEWTWGALNDLVELRNDKTNPGEHLAGRSYVPIECIGKRTLMLADKRHWQEAQSSLQLFERDDILFGAMRAYFHKVAPAPMPGVTRSTCFVLRPRKADLRSYSLMTLFRDETVAYATAHSRGSTIPYAQWKGSLERLACPIPDDLTLGLFEQSTHAMIQKIMTANRSIELLKSSRDLLLPRLISGQLSIAAAEREPQDAA